MNGPLESHPQLELVKKQQYGHSGMLSFYLKGKVYSYLGTIQVLRHHVFDFFRPTYPPLWWFTVLWIIKNYHFLTPPTHLFDDVIRRHIALVESEFISYFLLFFSTFSIVKFFKKSSNPISTNTFMLLWSKVVIRNLSWK